MKRIEENDTEAQSADIVADNLTQLKALFPEAFAEGKVQFETLLQLLGGAVDESDEKYGLNWHGKRRARQIALTPSTGTLRPCPEESEAWETTQNLMIEGDNLEVLKLLQKSYAGCVKMIYIDPPYNTGSDFVYPDDFRDSIKNYLELSGQADDGVKLSANTNSSGRFHTEWLNMMLPRLRLARSLLSPDGFIFVSIDDGEVANLRWLCDEVFGEECFVAQMIWKSRVSEDTRSTTGVSTDHEYILCYSRSTDCSLRGAEKDVAKFDNPDNDQRGPWRSADLTGLATRDARPNLHYDLIDPATKINYGCPPKGWRYERATMAKKIEEGRILFPADSTGRPRHKLFLNEMKSQYKNLSSVITSSNTSDGTREVNDLLGSGVFSFPKPSKLLSLLVEQATSEGDIVLDFFAGSGTMGHAVMAQSVADGANRRFVLVQLPEPLDPNNRDQKTASDFCDSIRKPRRISEITKERLRRSANRLQTDNPSSNLDLGFKVFRLDRSNIKAWDSNPANLYQTLLDHHEHIIEGRTEADIVYELLLKLGLDLCVPMESRVITGKTVGAVGGGVLMLCLAEAIAAEEVEALAAGIVAWHTDLAPAGDSTVVFRDSAFADDVAKTNMAAVLAQNGLENVRSL